MTMLRKAKVSDVKTIHKMITLAALEGEVLPRSLMDIYGSLRDFLCTLMRRITLSVFVR